MSYMPVNIKAPNLKCYWCKPVELQYHNKSDLTTYYTMSPNLFNTQDYFLRFQLFQHSLISTQSCWKTMHRNLVQKL